MPLRFHKSIRILPGVRLNINKRSMSITTGGKHEHLTVNTKGQRTESVDLPGPFSWRRTTTRKHR
ncbi:hypothetical protein ABIA33_002212 [Streptacidiphilus sp. MAP12-16]|uniref:DUF4236 domain-containing protein n=1 Tax=Streptacidiphilus sp. MAP12-16 TaxID=3156300 RepID=UPI003513C737